MTIEAGSQEVNQDTPSLNGGDEMINHDQGSLITGSSSHDGGSDKNDSNDEKSEQQLIEYSDFTIPDGFELQGEGLDEFKSFAKAKGLTQEEAQKLVDIGAKSAKASQDRIEKQLQTVRNEWANASRSDAEIGGEKLQANLAIAAKALDKYGTPELSKLLHESGLGNHPEIIRAFYRVGNLMQEDKLISGSPAAPNKALQSFYPNSKHS